MSAPTAKRLNVQLHASWGDDLGAREELFSRTEATDVTGNTKTVISKKLTAGATDQTVDLSAFCTTATWILVEEVGAAGVGIKVGLAAAGKQTLAALGCSIFKNGAATPPTIYLDNVSGAAAAYVQITMLGSVS